MKHAILQENSFRSFWASNVFDQGSQGTLLLKNMDVQGAFVQVSGSIELHGSRRGILVKTRMWKMQSPQEIITRAEWELRPTSKAFSLFPQTSPWRLPAPLWITPLPALSVKPDPPGHHLRHIPSPAPGQKKCRNVRQDAAKKQQNNRVFWDAEKITTFPCAFT